MMIHRRQESDLDCCKIPEVRGEFNNRGEAASNAKQKNGKPQMDTDEHRSEINVWTMLLRVGRTWIDRMHRMREKSASVVNPVYPVDPCSFSSRTPGTGHF
jgi:hypothetical protein